MANLQTIPPRTPQPALAPPRARQSLPHHHSPLARFVLFCLICLGALYIVNPGLGIFEFIPDNLPVVGNLDEAGATALVIWAWREFVRRSPGAA